MVEARNPFRMRSSENIEYATFLRLFGPGVLDLIPKDIAWNRVLIFNSAPGGGKTTLFRLFTPSSLLSLYDLRAVEEYKDLFKRLKDLEVLADDGPQVLGVMLSLARNYDDLEDLGLEKSQKERLLFSLLNSRIILATLRNALTLKKLKYPDDLSSLEIRRPVDIDFPASIPVPCDGADLHKWASSLETNVCNAIDSFGSPRFDSLVGHETLYAPFLLRPDYIRYAGSPIASRILLLLDDVHKLTRDQRTKLLLALSELRLPMGMWLAERLSALPIKELMKSESTPGRDYFEIVLEDFWRNGNPKRYEDTFANIADRRVRLSREAEGISFAGFLLESLDGSDWLGKFSDVEKILSDRLQTKVSHTKLYDKWIEVAHKMEGTPRERALRWRTLDILIERDRQHLQARLTDEPLQMSDLDLENSAVKEGATLFIVKEFGFPYYFGLSKVAKLSSSNIEQFLDLGGDLFEEVISAKLLKQAPVLSPKRQEDILKNVADRFWTKARSAPNGSDVVTFLGHIARICQSESQRPTIPYPPGATGIAITMRDRDRLVDPEYQMANPEYVRLSQTLYSCISNNYLEVVLDYSQGKKGKKWMVLYLNRLLCLYFGLPLQYGSWRPQTLPKLTRFLPPIEQTEKLPVTA